MPFYTQADENELDNYHYRNIPCEENFLRAGYASIIQLHQTGYFPLSMNVHPELLFISKKMIEDIPNRRSPLKSKHHYNLILDYVDDYCNTKIDEWRMPVLDSS